MGSRQCRPALSSHREHQDTSPSRARPPQARQPEPHSGLQTSLESDLESAERTLREAMLRSTGHSSTGHSSNGHSSTGHSLGQEAEEEEAQEEEAQEEAVRLPNAAVVELMLQMEQLQVHLQAKHNLDEPEQACVEHKEGHSVQEGGRTGSAASMPREQAPSHHPGLGMQSGLGMQPVNELSEKGGSQGGSSKRPDSRSRACFDEIDVNKDGVIDRYEYLRVFGALSHDPLHAPAHRQGSKHPEALVSHEASHEPSDRICSKMCWADGDRTADNCPAEDLPQCLPLPQRSDSRHEEQPVRDSPSRRDGFSMRSATPRLVVESNAPRGTGPLKWVSGRSPGKPSHTKPSTTQLSPSRTRLSPSRTRLSPSKAYLSPSRAQGSPLLDVANVQSPERWIQAMLRSPVGPMGSPKSKPELGSFDSRIGLSTLPDPHRGCSPSPDTNNVKSSQLALRLISIPTLMVGRLTPVPSRRSTIYCRTTAALVSPSMA